MTSPDDLPFGKPWISAYFEEVDRMNPDGLLAWYVPEGSFRFANQPAAKGEDAIRKLLQDFYGSIQGMRHQAQGIWADAESGVFEAAVTFTRKDKRQVTIPAASILRVRDRRVHDFLMVMDAAPVAGDGAAKP